MNKRFKKLTKAVFIFTLIFSWIFSGWPQVLDFPPEIEKAKAETEIRRPTSFTDTGDLTTNETNAYDVANGTTFSITNYGGDEDPSITFHTWQTTSYSYTNTYLKVRYHADMGDNDTYAIAYSTTGCSGAFTYLVNHTSAGAVDTTISSVDIGASPDLSQFCVEIETEKVTGPDGKSVYIRDIWTEGTYTPPSNTLPVASLTSIDSDASNVTLTESTTTDVVCEATVTDDDGFANITSVEARLYETAQGAAGTADENYRYILTGDEECIPSGGSGNTENYACTFAVQFFANPADNWTCQITPTDTVGAGTADSDTIIVDATNALAVAASIVFGDMGLGTNSESSPIAVLVTNTGNTVMDPQVSSSADMSCATGTIPVANQKYAASTFTYSSGGVTLSGTDETLNLDLPKPTVADPPVTDNSYWGILIPATGVDGACTGANTFTAIAGS